MIKLIKIEFIRMSRNKKYLFMSIGMPVAFYLLFTAMIKIPNEEAQRVFAKEYLMSMTTFSLTSFSIFTLPFEIIEDKKNGWRNILYRFQVKDSYIYLVKIFKMIVLSVISIGLVFLVGFLFRGVHLTFVQWFLSGVFLLLGAIVFLSLGTIITNFKDEKTASVFSNLLFLILAILGGLWFPTNQFPSWLQTISKLTPTYHFRELAVGYINNGTVPFKSISIMTVYAVIFIISSFIISVNRKEDIV